ncbi:MAG: hypothetical protein ACRDSH_24940 [Pseudonocardiaceae bacterium]
MDQDTARDWRQRVASGGLPATGLSLSACSGGMAMGDSPDLRAAKRLLDLAKQQGFAFVRTRPDEDAPLRGVRETVGWIDELVVAGFSECCEATRRRRYSLIVPKAGRAGCAPIA